MRPVFAYLVLTAAFPAAGAAQTPVEAKRSAAPTGRVSIENPAGSIRVVGWDREEVAVSGTLGRGAEGVRLTGGVGRTEIEVEVEGHPHRVRSELVVHVPKASRLEIESYSAGITVVDVTGTVEAESVEGSLSISGSPAEVSAETVSGNVEVAGAARLVRAESVNGSVVLKGVSGDVEASSVNGTVEVEAGALERASLESVSGDVLLSCDVTGTGWIEVETVSGSLQLTLPAGARAQISAATFSGEIVNELGDQKPHSVSRFTSEQELELTTGSGGTKISLQTLSGDIRLRKR